MTNKKSEKNPFKALREAEVKKSTKKSASRVAAEVKSGAHHLALDTNTWIYLANGMEPAKLLKFIAEEVENDRISLLLPEIIITEWKRNKDNAVKDGAIKYFKGVGDSLDRILKLLGSKGERDVFSFLLDDKKEDNSFESLIKKFIDKRNEIEAAIADNISLIDNLFGSKKVKIIKIKKEIFVKAGEFALDKKAPFKTRNSFADALIVFSFIDYVEHNSIEDAIFISYNSDDFCERKDGKKSLHSDLEPDFTRTKSKFYHIVGEALKSIEDNILTDAELESIRDLQDYEPEECINCSENIDRYSPLYFSANDLLDERYIAKYDPNQTKFEFVKGVPKKQAMDFNKTIETSTCEYCATEHFICVRCGHINMIYDVEYGDEKQCDNCELTYFIEQSLDRKGMYEGTIYRVLKGIRHCINCFNEFDSNDPEDELCEECKRKLNEDRPTLPRSRDR